MLSISDFNLTFSKHRALFPAGRFAFTKLTGQKHKAGRSCQEASGFMLLTGQFDKSKPPGGGKEKCLEKVSFKSEMLNIEKSSNI